VLQKVKRRLTQRKNFKDPWTIVVFVDIHTTAYFQLYLAIKNYKTEYGRTIELTKNKKRKLTSIKITFTHLGSLKHHLKKICKCNINEYFERKWRNGNRAKGIVNEERPAILTFNTLKHQLQFKVSYELSNRYGTICV